MHSRLGSCISISLHQEPEIAWPESLKLLLGQALGKKSISTMEQVRFIFRVDASIDYVIWIKEGPRPWQSWRDGVPDLCDWPETMM
jgi:hypothetical protein